jgi:hypothetical protein
VVISDHIIRINRFSSFWLGFVSYSAVARLTDTGNSDDRIQLGLFASSTLVRLILHMYAGANISEQL